MRQFWLAFAVVIGCAVAVGPGEALFLTSGIWLGFFLGALFEVYCLRSFVNTLEEQSKTGMRVRSAITELASQAEMAWKDLRLARRALAAYGEETDWLEARLFGLSAALRPFDTPDPVSHQGDA